MQVPLGYKRGFWPSVLQHDLEARYRLVDGAEKDVSWNFAGQADVKLTRRAMLNAAEAIPVSCTKCTADICFLSRGI